MTVDCYLAIGVDIAIIERNFKSETMRTPTFDGEAFISALDSQRVSRKLTWKKVATEAGVSASTLTRLSQGKRPDVDSLAALCAWAGLKSDDFMKKGSGKPAHTLPLTQITACLRADPNLSPEGAKALETLIRSAYEQFRVS